MTQVEQLSIRPFMRPLAEKADWQPDPALKTEIEVRFIPDGNNTTRVELEHRRLDRYVARRDEMRRVFDSEGDWGRLLASFARAAEEPSSA